MNALDLLRDQHTRVDHLIANIEATDDIADKQRLFDELADAIAAHAIIEERLFYPAAKAARTEEMLHEAVQEHLSVKRIIADMMELEPDDDDFDAKLSVMKEQLAHHAHEEEEGKLFPQVRKLLSAEQLEALGGEMLALFEEVIAQEPRHQVPDEIEEAAHV